MSTHVPLRVAGLATQAQVQAQPSAILLDAVLAEVRATATEAQERGFLLSVGERLAAQFPLSDLTELEALAAGMNRALRLLAAGVVRLSVQETAIRIEHHCPPDDDPNGAPSAALGPDLLEGLYAGWFAAFGNDRLALTRIGGPRETLIFHYGR